MDEAQQRVWEMMAAMLSCMLVTHTPQGLRGRPMSAIIDQEKQTIHFLSDKRSIKDDEIKNNPQVLLSFSNGSSRFVSLQARADVSEDRELVRSLWNPGAQAFWPDGPLDPNVHVLVIDPVSAEYWDGPNSVVAAVKFAYALATGTVPDFGDNQKLAM